jgi:hypothetical protein
MTVAELVDRLGSCHPDAPVWIAYPASLSDGERNVSYVEDLGVAAVVLS